MIVKQFSLGPNSSSFPLMSPSTHGCRGLWTSVFQPFLFAADVLMSVGSSVLCVHCRTLITASTSSSKDSVKFFTLRREFIFCKA